MASKKHVFSQIEKKVFLDILKVYSHIVENKNTDGSTIREKNVAWEKITREYNVSPHVTAEISIKQLKRLWMNLKQRQREVLTKERQHRMATGGGPSTSSVSIDPDVAQIAPGLMVEISGSIDSSLTTKTPFPLITTPPPPLNTTPPPPPPLPNTIPLPPTSSTILEKEYRDRLNRASEIHALEKELLEHKIRECKAKADLAELLLERERSLEDTKRLPVSKD